VPIRPARPEDAAEISRLAGELGYPSTVNDIAARLTAMLASPSCYIAVADAGTALTGWVAVERRMLLELGERAELVGLIVDRGARRGGIGRELVAHAEAWAVAQGLRVIMVRSNVVRAESHPFYEQLGYERTKTQHAYTKRLIG
jgi:GNAT superfamily N-acetyltransferase